MAFVLKICLLLGVLVAVLGLDGNGGIFNIWFNVVTTTNIVLPRKKSKIHGTLAIQVAS